MSRPTGLSMNGGERGKGRGPLWGFQDTHFGGPAQSDPKILPVSRVLVPSIDYFLLQQHVSSASSEEDPGDEQWGSGFAALGCPGIQPILLQEQS